ncbi:unnamed protein product [Blepharisma stoltei]|uniref:J domain-containing protein n=1 Tax=Blepharisma stoltei TaxID=1481888 RepID=A0AAU9K784_9CILI|nr:unnamed protein product [Blepharisma stoltei]
MPKQYRSINHDDTAFLYFSALILLLMLLPVLYHFILYKIFKKKQTEKKNENLQQCICAFCEDKREKCRVKPTFGKAGVFQLVYIVTVGYLLLYTIESIKLDQTPQEIFDPYEILGIGEGSSEKEIKAAFRSLSKVYHPDKNPDYEEKYITIVKAYQSLTNEEAKRNLIKYGHPDGPQRRIFSIGLPEFLVNPENKVPVLIGFLIMILGIPISVIIWLSCGQKKDKNGVFENNKHIYAELLDTSSDFLDILYIIANSEEFSKLPLIEETEIEQIKAEFSEILREKSKDWSVSHLKTVLLLLSHINRKALSAPLQNQQDFILLHTPNILNSIIELGFILSVYVKDSKVSKINLFKKIIEVSQCITQGLPENSNELRMVPYLNDSKIINNLKTKRINTISDLKKNLDVLQNFQIKSLEDVKLSLQYFPEMEASVSACVKDEEDIRYGDIVTVSIIINKANIKENEKTGQVHSWLPFMKNEKYWVLISDPKTGQIYYVRSLEAIDKITVHEGFRFHAKDDFPSFKNNKISLEVNAISDSYLGAGVSLPLDIEVDPEQSETANYSDED